MPLGEFIVKRFSFFLLFISFARFVHAVDVPELATFPKTADRVIQRCYEQAMVATKKGKALCDELGYGDHWVCPESKEIRLKSLEQCKADAPKAKDQAAMLYLLGLLHQDFRYQPDNRECPQFYRYQEGSGVCVYKNDHFEQLIREFPESRYSDMAAFRQAAAAYRYYECEGKVLCAVENKISGWIEFLEKNPGSGLAGVATTKIVDSLNGLSDAAIDPRREDPRGLIKDVEDLRNIATKLSSENRERLTRSLDGAGAVLAKLQRAQQENKKSNELFQ